jgi:hypothetical protein
VARPRIVELDEHDVQFEKLASRLFGPDHRMLGVEIKYAGAGDGHASQTIAK